MPRPDLKRPMKLDRPETTLVGDHATVLQVHIAIFPVPTLHIGYGFGTLDLPAKSVTTLAVPVDELPSRFPATGTKLAQGISDIIDGAYDFLREAGVVGPGVRA